MAREVMEADIPCANSVNPILVENSPDHCSSAVVCSSSPGGKRNARPINLAEGDLPVENFEVFASARYTRCYLLDGHERISWSCRVADGYDIIFCTRVSSTGLPYDDDHSREITERERAAEFNGYLDLRAEHAKWFTNLGTQEGSPMLILEFDNSYSYFTAKTIELQLTKIGDVSSYNNAITSCEVKGHWEHAFQLLDRMRDVNVTPDLNSYNAVLGVCNVAKQWENALKLLHDMKQVGPAPDTRSYINTINACESDGRAELALQLMDEMEALGDGSRGLDIGAPFEKKDNLDWFKWMLSQSIDCCPRNAHKIRDHLLAAQQCVAELSVDHENP